MATLFSSSVCPTLPHPPLPPPAPLIPTTLQNKAWAGRLSFSLIPSSRQPLDVRGVLQMGNSAFMHPKFFSRYGDSLRDRVTR